MDTKTRPNINPIPNQAAIKANTHGQTAEVLTQPSPRINHPDQADSALATVHNRSRHHGCWLVHHHSPKLIGAIEPDPIAEWPEWISPRAIAQES